MSDSLSGARPLTDQEYQLAKWMLEHGTEEAPSFLPQLESVQVTSWRCLCGCASINFALNGREPSKKGGLGVLGDFVFGPESEPSGIFIFEKEDMLAGIEVYGLAGDAPTSLPSGADLRPFLAKR